MSEITLTASVRRNLLSLHSLNDELAAASHRAATKVRVATAIDDAENYYAAQTLGFQSKRLEYRLDGMSETSSMVKAADNGITNVKGFISQMKGVIDSALATTDSGDRREYGLQFNELITQVRDMVKDSHHDGVNLLYDNMTTTVQFSASYGISQLSVEGVNISAADGEADLNGELGSSSITKRRVITNTDGTKTAVTDSFALTFDNGGKGVIGIKSAGTSGDDWEIDWGSTDYQATLSALEASLEDMEDSLSAQASIFAADLSIISMREDFTQDHMAVLDEGSGALTLTDLDEDSALILSLQNYQSVAIQCLSMSSYSAQQALSVLMT
jgi:flagellin-like hook-associated protein FlgL